MNLSSRQLFHLRLRLLQPERHLHLAVHRRRGADMFLRLLAIARAPVELAEAEVAVGDEGAHAEIFGEGKGTTIRGFGMLRVCEISARAELTKKPQGIRLMSPLPEVAGESEGLAAKLACLLYAASQQIRFAEMGDPERII